ncbi:MAG TPA: DUF4215 domain-containing protein [Kofleriaceae bacterium]|nr:DUF4215 domain-containing protein [Kofleriaceae bacterium]
MSRRGGALFAAAIGALHGCGNGNGGADAAPPAVCGDMVVEPPEQCDDGNADQTDACRFCRSFQPHRTLIKWTFNADPMDGFAGDGCSDVAATQVKVDLTGASTVSKTTTCEQFQATFDGLPAGDYTAAVTPLDVNGTSLVRAPGTTVFSTDGSPNMSEQHEVAITPNLWSRAYTGSFLFIFKWAMKTCTTAQPPVARQRVKLTINSVPVTTVTMWNGMQGYPLDGSVAAPCVLSNITLAERANALPFGPAQLTVQGTDAQGNTRFEGTFDTFVGAGTANPVLTFDVPVAVDAGVDAPVDAPIDAPPM